MRFRLPLRRAVLLVALFFFALVALIPLRVAAGLFDADGRGLAAREASGSIWLGVLKEAQFGRIALGDLQARLNALPLLLGRARVSLSRDDPDAQLEGAVTMSSYGFGVDGLTGRIPVAAAFAPLPIAALDLTDVGAWFAGGLCESAEGQVRATLSGEMAGVMLPAGLSGNARCAEGALLLPLASQSGMEQLNLSLFADGRYRADIIVRPADALVRDRLTGAGFTLGPSGYVRRLDGNF